MKITDDLFKNLTNYNVSGLESVEIGKTKYKTLILGETCPNAVFAQAFGASYGEESYNKVLARTISDLRNYFRGTTAKTLEIVVQAEVGECLKNMGVDTSEFDSIGELYAENEIGKMISKIDTYGMLKKTQEVLKEKGFLDDMGIFVVGHPGHMHRILKIAEKMHFKPVPIIPFISDENWFPGNDPQIWVRSKYFWVPREILTRIHHKIKGIM